MMKPVLMTALGAALAVAAVFAIGSLLPATREASASRTIPVPPEVVHATILDVASQPGWRSGIAAVEPGAEAGSWTEVSRTGETIHFRLISQSPDRIAMSFESPRGYSGQWEASLTGTQGGRDTGTTTITVREQATTPAPIGRILARLLFDQQAFAATYLDELAAEAVRRQNPGS